MFVRTAEHKWAITTGASETLPVSQENPGIIVRTVLRLPMHREFIELLEANADHAETHKSQFDDVQESQEPGVVTVCCSDSRVLQDHMWGNDEPGRIFTCGNIGNRVVQRTDAGDVVSGDVLYPVAHTGTETIVVVGHTGCGAVTATYDDLTDGLSEPDGISHCLELLKPHLEPGVELSPMTSTERRPSIGSSSTTSIDRSSSSLKATISRRPSTLSVSSTTFRTCTRAIGGEVHVINVDGETDVDAIREEYPDLESRIERRWEY